jgi:hypothetical protein
MDTDQIQTWINTATYDIRGDLDLDGDVDTADKTAALAHAGTITGWKDLTSNDIGNYKGYAGYEFDDVIQRRWSTWHVRHRVLTSTLGRWMQADGHGSDARSIAYSYSPIASNTIAFNPSPIAVVSSLLQPQFDAFNSQGQSLNSARWAQQCCAHSEQLFGPSNGRAVCCGSVPIVCMRPDLIASSLFAISQTLSCLQEISDCVLEHELLHHQIDVDCTKCPVPTSIDHLACAEAYPSVCDDHWIHCNIIGPYHSQCLARKMAECLSKPFPQNVFCHACVSAYKAVFDMSYTPTYCKYVDDFCADEPPPLVPPYVPIVVE